MNPAIKNTLIATPADETAAPAVPANDLVATAAANDTVATPRSLGKYLYAPWRVDKMLTDAGYDATLIPAHLRKAALWVAWCFAKNLFDVGDIAEACLTSRREVRTCVEALRRAAKPGTKVG